MDYFNYYEGALFAEDVPVSKIAEHCGTPCYVYSKKTLVRHWNAFNDAMSSRPHLICFAVKSNSNLAVLSVLAELGSGFDIVSMGELARVIAAGGDPKKVVFSGVAKTEEEIRFALQHDILCFNVESENELERITRVAQQMGTKARISIRINPDVDAKTHPYISTGLKSNKFGVSVERALAIYEGAQHNPHIEITGVDCHIGSQLTELAPFTDALDRLLVLIDELTTRGIVIKHLDLGGGLGVPYDNEQPPHPSEYAEVLAEKLKHRPELVLILEPGRAISANAGILLTRVEFLKAGEDKEFAIVDAAMNDLIRPSLYQAYQNIIPVQQRSDVSARLFDVVGPVCETGDFLGKDRTLAIAENDLLAVRSAGAYGFVMASNYNTRCRPAEVMVDGYKFAVVRKRETLAQLWAGECTAANGDWQ